MTVIVEKIQELKVVTGLSKHERLVQGILNAIDEDILRTGDALPSVNQMVYELGFARKTIVKAYTELKDRGIIESRNRLGYFITNDSTGQQKKVMLLMYAFNLYQQIFFKNFKARLGGDIQVDTFFHHNDLNVFKNFLSSNMGNYGMYVVAPVHHKEAREILQLIPPNKLLLVDRFEDLGDSYSHITQEFEETVYKALIELKPVIDQFEEFVLFFKQEDNPFGICKAFQRFVKDYQINGRIEPFYELGSVNKGSVYFPLADTDLLDLLKDCNQEWIALGKEVGVLTYDDTPVKEIICGGITSISIDFKLMADKAADFVLRKKKIQEIMPGKLIRRASL